MATAAMWEDLLQLYEAIYSDGEVRLKEAVPLLSRVRGAGSGQQAQELLKAFAAADKNDSKGLQYEEPASAMHGGGGGYAYLGAGRCCLMMTGAPAAGDVDENAKVGTEILLLRANASSDVEILLEEAVCLLSREHDAGSVQELQEVKGAFSAMDKDACRGFTLGVLTRALSRLYGAGGGYLCHHGHHDPWAGVLGAAAAMPFMAPGGATS